MKIVFGAQTRSGSEFLVKLTRALLFGLPEPYSVITPGRVESMLKQNNIYFRDLYLQGCGWEYFEKYSISSVKIEDPAIDYLGHSVAVKFPEAKWLSTLRRLEDIIISHYNINTWGKTEEHVLQSFQSGIDLFEELSDQGRLYVLNIDEPEKFNVKNMAKFLGCEVTKKADWIASNWPKVNSLEYQKDKFKESISQKKEPPNLGTLGRRHPWIKGIEMRYYNLWKECS